MKLVKIIAIVFLVTTVLIGSHGISSVYAKGSKTDKAAISAEMVNINSSTVEELQQIRGIGPKLAARIITYRDEQGDFKTCDDILNVRGVGVAKFEKIKGQIRV